MIKDNLKTIEELIGVLPTEIQVKDNLTKTEKALLGKYVMLASGDFYKRNGYCFRTNRELMNDLNTDWDTVSNGLQKLVDLSYLVEVDKGKNTVKHFKVMIVDNDKMKNDMPSPLVEGGGEGWKKINVEVGKTDCKAKDILSYETQRIVKNVEAFNAPKKFKRLPQDSIEEKVLTYLLTVTENGVKHYTTTFQSVERLLDYAKGAFQHLIEQHLSKNGVGGALSDEQLCKCLKYTFDYYQTIAKETFHNELVVVCYKLGKGQKPFYTVVLKKPIQAKEKIEIEAKDELEESAEAPILSEDEKLLELVLAQDISFKTYLNRLTNTWGIKSYQQQCTKKVETAAVENSAKEVLKKLISEECEKRYVALQKSSAVG